MHHVLPQPAVVQLFDLRRDTSIHHFSMVVNVRDAGAHGHAWVSWIRHVSDDDRQTYAFGYFAQINGYTEIFNADGDLHDEASRPLSPGEETRLAMVFWLDEDQFYHSLRTTDRWQGLGRYSLFSRDCVTFVADVLSGLGVDLPKRALAPSPWQYIVAFSELYLWHKVPRPA